MRYYSFTFQTNIEQLEENATVKFKEYRGEDTLSAMNTYMYKHMINHVRYFAYRADGDLVYATFAYDERKSSHQDAYDYIRDQLRTLFRINRVKSEASEITMYQFFTMLMEGRRRELIVTGRYTEDCGIEKFYPEWRSGERKPYGFDFSERIVSGGGGKSRAIHDQGFIRELKNIEENDNIIEQTGNPVHYSIAARSREAGLEMTETLTLNLLNAGRISSRRLSVISEISPYIFRKDNRLEDIIENNYGGAIAIDLSENFGSAPEDYTVASKYIEGLFKRYRNQCLFIFTYNLDSPGFAFYLLRQINKYAVTVPLREGSGDRKAATSYLKTLIRESEYSQYSAQAAEFMKLFPGNEFSQTDVIMAFEQFGPWCINRNVLHTYDFELSDTFVLDRDSDGGTAEDRLNGLIGLDIVKKQIEGIIAADIVEKERKKYRGSDYQTSCMHMIFSGNPGTAKTTVAKLFAGMAKEKGILKSGAFVDRSGIDLDGFACVHSIRDAFTAAEGGVLFIDEAYAITSGLAITTLLQELENRRDKVIVILAGYGERMHAFVKRNEGLKSRIPHWVDFPDYSTDELTGIFNLMLKERGFKATDGAAAEARYILEKARCVDDFGNGRYVRNLIDRAIQNQSVRLLGSSGKAEDIRKRDLFLITEDDISTLDEGLREERKTGTAKAELEELIGLSSAKKVIRRAVANYKLTKLCMDKGIPREKASMHMVFTGNPGTAKTTVARLFAEMLRDEKVLSTGAFVEAGRADLVGEFTGQTAPMVRRRFMEAKGGVLFIDEAYSLCDYHKNSYGDEAINTIVQEMENHRDDVIVIFAGYPEPMERFLERNPGMRSRIAFRVEFEDYSAEELCEITKVMARKKGLTVTDAAMEKLRGHYETARLQPDYGNGRFVRKMLEEAEMNLAERLMRSEDIDSAAELITTIEECDIPEMQPEKKEMSGRIGFVA